MNVTYIYIYIFTYIVSYSLLCGTQQYCISVTEVGPRSTGLWQNIWLPLKEQTEVYTCKVKLVNVNGFELTIMPINLLKLNQLVETNEWTHEIQEEIVNPTHSQTNNNYLDCGRR